MTHLVHFNDNGEPTTTSLAIAEGVGNTHKTVIQLVRQNLSDLEEFGLVAFEMAPRPEGQHGGGSTEYAVLNEPQATLLLTYMRNNDVVRAFKKQLVKAFFELRTRVTAQDPVAALSDPHTLRNLLLKHSEKVIELEAANAELEPKADALDRIATANGSMCLRDAAKSLQVREKDFLLWMQSHNWIYKRFGTSWIAYADKLKAGYLEHKVQTVQRNDGSEKVVEQCRVTPLGLTRLSKHFEKRAA